MSSRFSILRGLLMAGVVMHTRRIFFQIRHPLQFSIDCIWTRHRCWHYFISHG